MPVLSGGGGSAVCGHPVTGEAGLPCPWGSLDSLPLRCCNVDPLLLSCRLSWYSPSGDSSEKLVVPTDWEALHLVRTDSAFCVLDRSGSRDYCRLQRTDLLHLPFQTSKEDEARQASHQLLPPLQAGSWSMVVGESVGQRDDCLPPPPPCLNNGSK